MADAKRCWICRRNKQELLESVYLDKDGISKKQVFPVKVEQDETTKHDLYLCYCCHRLMNFQIFQYLEQMDELPSELMEDVVNSLKISLKY